MKIVLRTATALGILGIMTCLPSQTVAQTRPLPRNNVQPRYSFQVLWSELLPENTKLIEVGRVKHTQENYLVMLSDSRIPKDSQRSLTLALWSGNRFITEGSATYLKGGATDALLVGQFRTALPSVNGTVKVGVKESVVKGGAKETSRPHNTQIVTSDSILEWNGKELERIALSPVGVKLGVVRGKQPGLMVAGAGDVASSYSFEGKELKSVAEFIPPSENETYAFYGCGTQTYPGFEQLRLGSGAHYVQSYWKNLNHWMIGYVQGKLSPLPDNPKATTSDSLVLLMPKVTGVVKSFWATSPTDMEEVWRSDGFPGRILDVRVGDPKNDGIEGILVLVATNEEKERRLYFIRRVDALNPRRP
ncbi:hypothetical protein LBMAG21_10630 [Armatimonadota bacterium]|nr:hypothetical protein LBMAG21_10630 [Armatimonadota bacterium]